MDEYEQFAQAVHNFWQEIARLLHIARWIK